MTTSTPMPIRIYLIRHGETQWSITGQHTGRSDIPLTAQGESQARDLAKSFSGIKFSHVLTSPQRRAQRTCQLAGLSSIATIEADLVEWDYGDYEGQLSADIRKQQTDWNLFRDGCPNGELPLQVSDRADRLIRKLCQLKGNIALFSHGQFGCVLATRWIGLPIIEAQHFALKTASFGVLGYDPHHPEVAVISMWNATSHESLDS